MDSQSPNDNPNRDRLTVSGETRRHEAIRQEFLEDAPEGREPTPTNRRRSWILFHSVLAVGVLALLIFLWFLGGWTLLLPGLIFSLGLYVIGFWADWAAVGLRAKDRKVADRKARIVEKLSH